MSNDLSALVSMLSPIPGSTSGWFYNAAVLTIGISFTVLFIRVYKGTKSRQLLNSLPGLWTSLGILGTFMAICISLGQISATNSIVKEGMTLGEIAALGGTGDVDIKQIISDLIPAFSTSIWGLIAAFIITVYSKCTYAKEDAAIDTSIGNKTPEEYIYQIATAISEQAIQNKQYNDRLNESINGQSQILETFVNNFVSKMDEIFKGMGESIKENITEFGERQFQNSASVLENVVQKMSESSDKLMTQQTASMSSIVESTNKEIAKISNSLSEKVAALIEAQSSTVASAVDKTNTKVKELSDTFTANISSFNTDTVRAMSEMVTSLKDQVQTITNASIQSIDKISATQEEKLSSLVKSQTEFTDKVMTSAIEMNKKVTDDIRGSLSSIVSSLQTTIKSHCDSLAVAIVENTKLLKENYEYIEDHIGLIRTNYEQATLAYSAAVQNAHDYNESIEQKIKCLDSSLKVLSTTNANVSEIAETVKERYEKIEHLITNINEMATAIDTLQKLESQLNKINQKVA